MYLFYKWTYTGQYDAVTFTELVFHTLPPAHLIITCKLRDSPKYDM